MSIFLKLQLEFISRNQPHIILFREQKDSQPFLIRAPVPLDLDVILSLLLLKLLIIVGFQLDQGLKDVLVLLRVLVP
jgi:hypothetical protein